VGGYDLAHCLDLTNGSTMFVASVQDLPNVRGHCSRLEAMALRHNTDALEGVLDNLIQVVPYVVVAQEHCERWARVIGAAQETGCARLRAQLDLGTFRLRCEVVSLEGQFVGLNPASR
jgi:hypothetical protein